MGQNIKGSIVDSNTRIPIDAATVFWLKTGSGDILQSAITATDGTFTTTLPVGTYDIKVTMIGYEAGQILGYTVLKGQNTVELPLKSNGATQLKTVDIASERTTIETQLDKKVFNVGQELVAKGGNATDILNNVPSVSVSPLGAVSLRGNTSVRILINGKPSAITNNNGLLQIPAETIEKVEVITNPSAEYDAQGAAGIINIVLKKNRKAGLSSSFTIHGGLPRNNGLGMNTSYKTNKINVFGDLRYARIAFDGDSKVERANLIDNGTSAFIYQRIRRYRSFERFNVYLGSDVYLNSKNTLTFSYLYRYNLNRDSVFFENLYKNAALDNIRTIHTVENYREPQHENVLEANYAVQLGAPKKSLKFNVQYLFWNDDENERITESDLGGPSPIQTALGSRDIERSKELVVQGDYNAPVGEQGKVSMGVKGEIRRIFSDYDTWENNLPIDSMTNVLEYRERIYGTYAQYSNAIQKFQYQIGVRVEHFKTGSDDEKNIFYTSKKYTNVFPSVHLTYKLAKLCDIQVSYSKRIDRPRFPQINPFGGIADRRNIRIGNPDLNPMYIDVAEIGTLVKLENGLVINPAAYFQYTKNLFDVLVTRNEQNVLIEKPINLGTETRVGFELSTTFSPTKWWFLSNDINAYHYVQKGIFEVTDMTWFTRLNSRIKFKKWAVQNSFNYTGAKNSGQISDKAIFVADMSIARDFLKDKASLTLRADNFLNTRVNRFTVRAAEYSLYRENRPVGARFMLAFTYKLNRAKTERDRLPGE